MPAYSIKDVFEQVAMPAVSEMARQRAQRHGRIETVVADDTDGVFLIQGRFPLQLGLPTRLGLTYMGRTMTIIRQGNELTLINCIHLSERGYAQLDALGAVRNVVRLGSFHGAEDVHLLTRYGADYWVMEGMDLHHGIKDIGTVIHKMSPGGVLPVEGARLFALPGAVFPEGMLLLKQGGGVLVTVDSMMNNPRGMCLTCGRAHTSLATHIGMSKMGMLGPGKAGGPWLEANYHIWNRDPRKLLLPFYRDTVFKAEWNTLVTGHGPAIVGDAKEQAAGTLQAQFKTRLL